MAFHHGTIRKYTGALLSVFNDLEIEYNDSEGNPQIKSIPLVYSSKEKAEVLDEVTTEQILSGNYSSLPRAALSLTDIGKMSTRATNKNNKINTVKGDDNMQFSFNSVPYEFSYTIIIQCRGMNELCQIVEQIAPKFNPTLNIDIWDAENLSEPTRVPLVLTDISWEDSQYEELSANIFTISITLSLGGHLYQPIKSHDRIKQYKMAINEIVDGKTKNKSLKGWDIEEDSKPGSQSEV